jgi:hypothetical protein
MLQSKEWDQVGKAVDPFELSFGSASIQPDKTNRAPVAQLDRASDYESEGRMFESCRAHHENKSTYWISLLSSVTVFVTVLGTFASSAR